MDPSMTIDWLRHHKFVDMEHAIKVLGNIRVTRLLAEYINTTTELKQVLLLTKETISLLS